MPYTLDVTETKRISPTLNAIEAEFGAPVDLLLNNAGMSREGRLLDAGEDTFDEVMQTNARAPFFMAQAVARRLVETKREGSIINVASLIVLRPNAGIGVYGMSKASVDFMTRAMAKEWVAMESVSTRCSPATVNRNESAILPVGAWRQIHPAHATAPHRQAFRS